MQSTCISYVMLISTIQCMDMFFLISWGQYQYNNLIEICQSIGETIATSISNALFSTNTLNLLPLFWLFFISCVLVAIFFYN